MLILPGWALLPIDNLPAATIDSAIVPQRRSFNVLNPLGGIAVKAALALTIFCAGCRQTTYDPLETQDYASLRVLMPHSVNIVEPFTTWADFDGTPGIDGINVFVQPVNAAGDPIQASGDIYVELHALQPASADPKGESLGIWDFPLHTQSEQDARWRRAVQMYDFPIQLPASARSAKPATKYVLSVTCNPPVGERRTDEYILETPLATGAMRDLR